MGLKGKNKDQNLQLIARKEVSVRFSEVDAMGIVWHGNYLKFFEDGREEFGNMYDLDFVKLYKTEGFLTPIVNVDINYKKSLKLGEQAIVETVYVPTDAAKIVFTYNIYSKSSNELITTGCTTQVFLKENELFITNPPFFETWKSNWLK